jgi:hypothetical protein
MYGLGEIGVLGFYRFGDPAGLQSLRGPVEPLAQGPMLIGVTEFAEKPPDSICPAAGFLHFTKPIGVGDLAGLGVFEHTAFEFLALPRPFPINPASPILAKGGAGLGKAGHRDPASRNLNRQTELPQSRGVFPGLELDEIEQGPVAAQAA